MKPLLTDREREAMAVVRGYFEKNKVAITFRGLAKGMELSIGAAQKIVRQLRRKGYLKQGEKATKRAFARSIEPWDGYPIGIAVPIYRKL